MIRSFTSFTNPEKYKMNVSLSTYRDRLRWFQVQKNCRMGNLIPPPTPYLSCYIVVFLSSNPVVSRLNFCKLENTENSNACCYQISCSWICNLSKEYCGIAEVQPERVPVNAHSKYHQNNYFPWLCTWMISFLLTIQNSWGKIIERRNSG